MANAETPPAEPAPRIDGRSLRYGPLRKRLLRGAIEYVLEHGVSDLSMRPLAKALGVSQAALSNHFGSKEQLITEVLANFRTYTVAASRRREEEFPEAEGFEPYERWWADWTSASVDPALRLIFECYGLAFRHPERYADFLAHAVHDWLDMLRRFLTTLGCPDDEVDDYATIMFGLMTGMQIDLLTTGDRERLDRAHAAFITLLESRRATWQAPAA